MAKTNDFMIFELADIEKQIKILVARKKELLEEAESKWERLKEEYRQGKFEMEEKQ